MDDIIDKYKELKKELYDSRPSCDDKDFSKLVEMKDVDPNLKETLILLHSNYKTELHELRSETIRMLFKIIDQNIEAIDKLERYHLTHEATEKVAETTSKKEGVTQNLIDKYGGLNGIQKVTLCLILIVLIFWILDFISPDSFRRSTDTIGKIITLNPANTRLQNDVIYNKRDNNTITDIENLNKAQK